MNFHSLRKLKNLFSFALLLCAGSANTECGYKSCNPIKEDHMNIHLVPHSHDDLGYLKTVEQYYYGAHDDYQQAGVQYILDSVIAALVKNNTRRFIYAETGFFCKWWLQQDEETKNTVKDLVNNGQLEFVGGGWSMNDEASADYQSIIDQMTWGLRKLNETFGDCGQPRVSWQIDPFGHSREMASIFAQLGFDGFFLNRIDYEELALRSSNRSMEFIWRGSPDNLGDSSDIYTNILFRHYNSPDGLCFDVKCNDEPVIDDVTSPEYNVNRKAEDFINNWIVPATQAYASNNILVPMGDDFHYQYAGKYFKNMDKLIKYVNAREFNGTKYNVMYSTPSCYLNAVYEATNGTLNSALKTDDFFPYASTAHNYWTGYFTSRPTGKRYSRYANNFLQVCKQLNALTNVISAEDIRLDVLRESLGIFQHHDAITGTEREHVAHDYIRMIHDGIVGCEGVANQTLFRLVKSVRMTFTTCPMLNVSACGRSENDNLLIITVYNPLSRPVDKFVRLPIVNDSDIITIKDPAGNVLVTQTVPIHPSFFKVPGRTSKARFEIVFKAEGIPPLGFKSFYFEKQSKGKGKIAGEKVRLNNYEVNGNAGDPIVRVEYLYYNGMNGNYSSDEFSPSQPYVFRPDPDNPITKVNMTGSDVTYQGPLVVETHSMYGDYISQIKRKYENDSIEEFGYLVGPLPYENQGIEVIGRYRITNSLDHNGIFYTDTNGRGSIRRITNYRPTWNVSVTEPVAGNYYPVTSNLFIQGVEDQLDMALFTDRSQGGTSPGNSQLELMIHRNTMSGGPGALAEPLNEQAYGTGVVTRGSHYVLLRNDNSTLDRDKLIEEISQEINLDSWIFFASPNGVPFNRYRQGHTMEFSALNNSLPRQVHILTLEPWGPSTLLFRLENFIGKNNQLSKTVNVNVKGLFSTFDVVSIKETTLGANQWLDVNKRMTFNKKSTTTKRKGGNIDDFDISLDPMEIRTFIMEIAYK